MSESQLACSLNKFDGGNEYTDVTNMICFYLGLDTMKLQLMGRNMCNLS